MRNDVFSGILVIVYETDIRLTACENITILSLVLFSGVTWEQRYCL